MQSMATRHPHTGAPKRLYSLIEWRALAEMASLPFSWPLLAQLPRGDGHPVLLLPGFMGDEGSLSALKLFLGGRGYDVQTWGLGRNIGFQRRHAQALEQKIRHLHHSTGRRVSLVGWSLGGVFALYGALQAPECVRHLVTLGSPVNVGPEGSQASPLVKVLYRMVAHPMGPEVHVMQPRVKRLREHLLPDVPMSCLYSLSDERWRGAAAGSHGGRPGRALREHPRQRQPHRPGFQPDGAVHRGRPPGPARGRLAAVQPGRLARRGLPADDARGRAALTAGAAAPFRAWAGRADAAALARRTAGPGRGAGDGRWASAR